MVSVEIIIDGLSVRSSPFEFTRCVLSRLLFGSTEETPEAAGRDAEPDEGSAEVIEDVQEEGNEEE